MSKLRDTFYWVPNFITLLNLVSGSMAVIMGIEGQLGWAAILIGAAAVFDFLDGLAARLLKAYSEIGKQLDSLADLISFGLAPAAMMMTMLELAMFNINRPLLEIDATSLQWIFLISVVIIPAAGAFRLAKFNIDDRQTENFLGLPIPANGLFYASLGLVLDLGHSTMVNEVILNRFNLLTVMIILSALMISEIPMFSLKFKSLKWQGNQIRYFYILVCIILIITLKLVALPLLIISYIVIALIQKLIS